MFDEVSPRYDLLNDVLSVGNSRLWRIATTRAIAPRKGMRVLDIAAGTGTSSAAIAAHGAHVTAADFSEGMLAEGRRRNADNPLIDFVWADATQLPFEDDAFDAATISYGLRNVNDPKRAIAEMARVVKPGGRIVIAEFSRPTSDAVNWAYTQYNRHVLPRVAAVINRDAAEAYRYLNESIESWPAQDELAAWMREAGLERVAYRNLSLGIVALHRGFVPRAKAVHAAKGEAKAADADAAEPKQEAAKSAAPKGSGAKTSGAKASGTKTSGSKTSEAKDSGAKAKPAGKSSGSAKAKSGSASTKSGSASTKSSGSAKSGSASTESGGSSSKSKAQSKSASTKPKATQSKPKAAAKPKGGAQSAQTKTPAEQSAATPAERPAADERGNA